MPTDASMNCMAISNLLKLSVKLADVSDSPRLDVEIILSYVLGKDRAYLYTWPNQILSSLEQTRFNELLRCRVNGEPVAYIIKRREFWSLPLKVSPVTIIPRPETELLIEKALSLPLDQQISVLDLGTGTGAIALALASEKPFWEIIAVDLEFGAVALAEENRQQFGFDNVKICQSNWFSNLKEIQFDLIVSNPPYLCLKDKHLQEGDVRFEPLSALVANDSGLADIHTVVFDSYLHLKPGGWLLLEHGHSQGKEVRQKMIQAGFSGAETFIDLSGLDRVSVCFKAEL